MNDITVTMPIKKYDEMRKQIQTLQANSVYTFVDYKTNNLEKADVDLVLDVGEIIDKVIQENPNINKLFVKDHDGLLVKPIKVNQKEADETIAYDEPGDNNE